MMQFSPIDKAETMDIRYDRDGQRIVNAQAKSGDGTAGMTRVNYDKLDRVANYGGQGAGLISTFVNNILNAVTGFNQGSSYFESFSTGTYLYYTYETYVRTSTDRRVGVCL